jgi:hypothetical protein
MDYAAAELWVPYLVLMHIGLLHDGMSFMQTG